MACGDGVGDHIVCVDVPALEFFRGFAVAYLFSMYLYAQVKADITQNSISYIPFFYSPYMGDYMYNATFPIPNATSTPCYK